MLNIEMLMFPSPIFGSANKTHMLAVIVILSIILAFVIATWLFMKHPKFGKAPSGARLERMKQSPHYKLGKFHNQSHTPNFAEGYGIGGVMYDFFFKSHPRRSPKNPIPSVKTDLHKLPKEDNVIVWFGHSSYFLQVDGKRILVDPVFSGNASPLPDTTRSFKGSDIYTVADIPQLDYLFISHDHYDHIDYDTIKQLKGKVDTVVCGLGVGEHFEYWGYDAGNIIELDWYQTAELDGGLTIHTAPARHFSGRGFSRNNTLWLSFLLQTSKLKIYLGGDSGYDKHFKEIGDKYGPIDLALLDNGQYNLAWQYIHALPEEVLQAAKDLRVKRLMPVHSSKFALSTHPWDEPLSRISAANEETNIPLVTPMIGEVVRLDDAQQTFKQWWVGVD